MRYYFPTHIRTLQDRAGYVIGRVNSVRGENKLSIFRTLYGGFSKNRRKRGAINEFLNAYTEVKELLGDRLYRTSKGHSVTQYIGKTTKAEDIDFVFERFDKALQGLVTVGMVTQKDIDEWMMYYTLGWVPTPDDIRREKALESVLKDLQQQR